MNQSKPAIRTSTPAVEGIMRASKWLKHQALLDEEEMGALFHALGSFEIFVVSEPVTEEKMQVTHAEFLEKYALYVGALKNGELPDEAPFRKYFSSIFTTTSDALYAMEVGKGKFLLKTVKPVIQLQAHHFFVSSIDGKFHPLVFGSESITWGIQFSYPQLFQDPVTQEFSQVKESDLFPNTALYKRLASWLRTETVPSPFVFQGKRSNEPIRLGKKCFSWIGKHAGLKAKGVSIYGA